MLDVKWMLSCGGLSNLLKRCKPWTVLGWCRSDAVVTEIALGGLEKEDKELNQLDRAAFSKVPFFLPLFFLLLFALLFFFSSSFSSCSLS